MTTSQTTIAEAVERLQGTDRRKGYSFLSRGAGGALDTRFISFEELAALTAQRAGALQAAGLRKQDRLAIILPENDDFIITFLACIRAGIIPVPIYPMHGLGQLGSYLENLRHIIRKSGAAAVVTTRKIKLMLGTLQDQCETLHSILATESLAESSEPMRPERITLDDVAFLQFTSGSTSRPKGVTLTHGNLAANIQSIMEVGFKVNSEDVGISWLPLFHDMGLIGFVLAPLFYHRPIVYIPPLLFLQRPVTWLEAHSRFNGTISCAPNFAFGLCVKRIPPEQRVGMDLSAWRIAGSGGEPIRAQDLRLFADAFAPLGFKAGSLMPMYGMAESSLAIALGEPGGGVPSETVDHVKLSQERVAAPPEQSAQRLEIVTCGPPFPGHGISVFAVDDESSATPLPDGQVGEIRLKGPSVMKEYWNDPEQTQRAFAGGYLRTGDLGYLRNGKIHVCGRLKEMIILGGRNYFPQDIEVIATTVPGTRKGNLIAFGTRGVFGGEEQERVVLAVEVAQPELFDPALVVRALQSALSITLEVVVLRPGQLPKTSSGKLQRAKTRELYEANLLQGHPSMREKKWVDVLKHLVVSQTGFLKSTLRGKQ